MLLQFRYILSFFVRITLPSLCCFSISNCLCSLNGFFVICHHVSINFFRSYFFFCSLIMGKTICADKDLIFGKLSIFSEDFAAPICDESLPNFFSKPGTQPSDKSIFSCAFTFLHPVNVIIPISSK